MEQEYYTIVYLSDKRVLMFRELRRGSAQRLSTGGQSGVVQRGTVEGQGSRREE